MVVMVNGVGATVPITFLEDANLCMLVNFPWSAHFYLAFSGDGCAFFHHRKTGFKLMF